MQTSLPAGAHDASLPTPAPAKKGNGHGPRIAPDSAKSFEYSDDAVTAAHASHSQASDSAPGSGNLRLAPSHDAVSQQGANMQADAPACDVCGSITVRSGTCYKCLNCGNSMGCS